jgi:hypothetical protein
MAREKNIFQNALSHADAAGHILSRTTNAFNVQPTASGSNMHVESAQPGIKYK